MNGTPKLVLTVATIVLSNVIAIAWWIAAAKSAPGTFWSEPAAAWFQAIATVDALAMAILVPAWQHDLDRQGNQEERERFADAFSLRLLPQIRSHAARLELDIEESRKDAEQGASFWTDGDAANSYPFIVENWDAIAKCSPALVHELVTFARAIDASRCRYSLEHDVMVYPREHEPDLVEISFANRQRLDAYIDDLTLAAASLRRAIAIVEG